MKTLSHDKKAWMCEVIGIEFKGGDLQYHQVQRFLKIAKKNPKLEYVPPKEKSPPMLTTVQPQKPMNSEQQENALLARYDLEIKEGGECIKRFTQKIKETKEEVAAAIRKRKQLAKVLGVNESIEAAE